ncbi:hypothetical protein ANCCAN_22806, partial [Ancylostoma caninum]
MGRILRFGLKLRTASVVPLGMKVQPEQGATISQQNFSMWTK